MTRFDTRMGTPFEDYWHLIRTVRWPLLHFRNQRGKECSSFPKQVTNRSGMSHRNELAPFDDRKVIILLTILMIFGDFRWLLMIFRDPEGVTVYHHCPYHVPVPHYPGAPTTCTTSMASAVHGPSMLSPAVTSSPGSFWLQRVSHVTRSFCLIDNKPEKTVFGGFSW